MGSLLAFSDPAYAFNDLAGGVVRAVQSCGSASVGDRFLPSNLVHVGTVSVATPAPGHYGM
jgi:hypothetical protein